MSTVASLLQLLPFPEAHRIVELRENSLSTEEGAEIRILAAGSSLFQDVSAHWLDHVNLSGGNRPELIAAGLATADFFRLVPRRAVAIELCGIGRSVDSRHTCQPRQPQHSVALGVTQPPG